MTATLRALALCCPLKSSGAQFSSGDEVGAPNGCAPLMQALNDLEFTVHVAGRTFGSTNPS